jgi:triosephosphate isomerase
MLNHDGAPLDRAALASTVRRAASAGLRTMVCAGSDEQALDIARLQPTIVLYEPPELIGRAGGGDRPWIRPVDERVHRIAPDVLMMHAGGVARPEDAYRIMLSGAQGTGSTSGVLGDAAPQDAVVRFIAEVRRGFDAATHA